jgi:hypothetical protein
MEMKAISIAANMTKLVELVETSDDMTPEMIADTLDGMKFELSEKLDSIYSVVRNLDGLAQTCGAEAARLSARKRSFENSSETLRKYVLACLIAAGEKTLKTTLNTFTARKGLVKVVIDNANSLPDEFVSVETVITPDKKAIKEAIEAKKDVPGAHIEIGEESLQVR